MRKLFVFLLVVALVLLGLVATSGSASAKDKSCRYHNTTNVFNFPGYQDDNPEIFKTFPSYFCDKGGIEVVKVVANTKAEYVSLKDYAKANGAIGDNDGFFCKTGHYKGFFLDLAYSFPESDQQLTDELVDRWDRYIAGYKKSHNCVIYSL